MEPVSAQQREAFYAADRIDLLVRDAAVRWSAAFSPAVVFQLPHLAGDEPFGPDWQSLDPERAERLWTAAVGAAHDEGKDVDACARVLGVEDAPVDCPEPVPTSRLVVAGGNALLAVARRFTGRTDLSWSDQVLAVAERPVNRQLAGLVAPLIGALASTPRTPASIRRSATGCSTPGSPTLPISRAVRTSGSGAWSATK